MTIVSAHKTDTGRKRLRNEDYVWVDQQAGLYIVADGMGGHEAGDVASQLAATTIGRLIVDQLQDKAESASTTRIKWLMTDAIEAANETVFRAAGEARQTRKMGATIVVALVQSSAAYISHAGDARAYLAHQAKLTQLTEDDSWGAQFATAGPGSEENGQRQAFDHFVTKSLGQDTLVEPSFSEVKVMPGDWLLLCSDGLWNMVEDEQILAELNRADDDPARAVEALVTAANAAGGKDNISVVAITVLPVGS